jgi:beta-xylosidase
MQNERLWKADCGDGTYNNPILFADYSDPDVIRVADTFYMTASSFNYTPGLPILISKDLVNWELKNYAITNIDFERYLNPAHAKGIWAPAIRYHNNKYWISYGMPDEGIFIINAEDPLGKWSDPILLLEGKGFIDPCPFWDDDGRAYMIHGYAKSRIGFKSILGIFPMDIDGTKAIGDDRFIYDGTQTQETIEGPKVYKKNGWYYIFAPAGGVENGWQTVLRSKSLEGPFEERIVMHQGDSIINGPHQGALIDTASGEEWFVHFQDRGFYGRVTHLQPVTWVEDWPIIGVNPNSEDCGEPCVHYEKPKGTQECEVAYLEADDKFHRSELGLQWQWLGNHKKEFYSLDERKGFLRLFSHNPSGDIPATLWNSSNVLTQKFVCPMFEAEIKVDFHGLNDNEQTGCIIMGGHYVYMAIRKEKNQYHFVYVESDNVADVQLENVLLTKPIENGMDTITFRVVLEQEGGIMIIRMLYAFDNQNFKDTGFIFEPSDHTWVGAKLGLFSLALDEAEHEGYSDFEYIQVKNLSKGEL